MKVTLSWLNRNPEYDHIEIYRATREMTPSELVEPLATIPYGSDSYTDETAVRDTLYYYYVVIVKDNDKAVSERKTVLTMSDYGNGPQELMAGDFHNGYFGIVGEGAADFMSPRDVHDYFGLSNTHSSNYWYKFSNRGKILYIPRYYSTDNLSWSFLYSKGLVFGSGVGFNLPETIEPVEQNARITIEGREFKARLMSGVSSSGYDGEVSENYDSDSEWDTLLCKCAAYSQNYNKNGSRFHDQAQFINNEWCMESLSGGSAVVRYSSSNAHYQGVRDITSSGRYRLILELIP